MNTYDRVSKLTSELRHSEKCPLRCVQETTVVKVERNHDINAQNCIADVDLVSK